MEHDVNDPHYNNVRRESTSEALLLDQLDAEKHHLVEQSYSEQQRFIDIRPIAFHYCLKYASTLLHVAYRALSFYDRFLSRNNDIPVVIQGGGFERNLELFVFVCVKIAYREFLPQRIDQFVNSHQLMADERDVDKMELLISNGLEDSVTTPPTALNPVLMKSLISLLEIEEEQSELVMYYVYETLLAINEDIKFTKFRPSILTASAILVTCYKLYPVMYPAIAKKIFKSGYVHEVTVGITARKHIQLAEVQECFEELKDREIVDFIFNPYKRLPKGNVKREEGKELLIQDFVKPYEYAANREHPLKFVIEDD